MVHICDEHGCREKATTMVKLLTAYGLYCKVHGDDQQAKVQDHHQKVVRRGR